MFIMPVDLSQIKPKFWANLFSEVIPQIFYLGRVPDSCVRTDGDFLFLFDEAFLFEESRVDQGIRSLFGHVDGIV